MLNSTELINSMFEIIIIPTGIKSLLFSAMTLTMEYINAIASIHNRKSSLFNGINSIPVYMMAADDMCIEVIQ